MKKQLCHNSVAQLVFKFAVKAVIMGRVGANFSFSTIIFISNDGQSYVMASMGGMFFVIPCPTYLKGPIKGSKRLHTEIFRNI